MSLFRQASKWSLRALIIWGAIEAGGGLYAAGAETAMGMGRLAGHEAALSRLEDRAREGEQMAQSAEAALASLHGDAWAVPLQGDETLPRAAARALRAELIALGAEAATVDAGEASAASGLVRITLTARWREPSASSPAVVHGLAQRFPNWRIERLALTRGDVVSSEMTISVSVHAAPRQEASR
jgi:hypothetical protein